MRKKFGHEPHSVREERQALHLVYGRKPVLEIFRHTKHRIVEVLIVPKTNLSRELAEFIEQVNNQDIHYVEGDDLDRWCDGGNHQGIAIRVKPAQQITLEQVIERSKHRKGLLVVCDQVNDPQNLGTIMRVAEAAGADGLIVTTDRSAPVGDTSYRASAGACEFLPIVSIGNLQRALRDLKASGFWVVGLQKTENSSNLYTTSLPDPLVVVLGSEGKGLRRLTVDECDLLVAIPMEGFIESLNVSQAASVFLYEVLRRRHAGK